MNKMKKKITNDFLQIFPRVFLEVMIVIGHKSLQLYLKNYPFYNNPCKPPRNDVIYG